MKLWLNKLKYIYLGVTNSIAFYPSLLAIVFLLFSFVIIKIEFNEVVIAFKESISPFLVHSSDNARLILGTIVGSLISLMVFSFSMVMVVLNSATATLSPRVLPNLISNKFHQIVLGFYIGSIIFSLNLIVNIDSPDIEYATPSLGIFFSMNMVIVCLGLFVYFIHSISQKIQVDNILNSIYNSTKAELKNIDADEPTYKRPDTEKWINYSAEFSGYLKQIDYQGLKQFCKKHEVKLKVDVGLGSFVAKHYPFFQANKALDEDLKKNIMAHFTLYMQERIADHYSFGFKQISEIAVKALSPGINDPGTAIKAIDLLSDLYIQLLFVQEKSYLLNDEDEICVYLSPISYEDLMYLTLIPIREYGHTDIMIFMRLLDCLEHMLYVDKNEKKYTDVFYKFINNIISCSQEHVDNKLDKERINERIHRINKQFDQDHKIAIL